MHIRWYVGAVVGLAIALLASQSLAANAAGKVTISALKNAVIPAACGFKGGRLHNGSLPKVSPGFVRLDPKLTRLGPVLPRQTSGAAATFHCSHGGVSWPDFVVIYDSSLKPLRVYNTGSIGYYSGRAEVQSVSLKNRVATVHAVAIGQPGDSDQWGTASSTVVFHYNTRQRKIVQSRAKIYTERADFLGLISAVNAHDRKRALRYGTSSMVATLFSIRAWSSSSLVPRECDGFNDLWDDDRDRSLVDIGQRACHLQFNIAEAHYSPLYEDEWIVMNPTNSSWTSFKGTALAGW